MDYQKTLEEIFYDNIGTKESVLEHLGAHIVQAAQMLSEALLAERKILLCGEGLARLDAQRFASQLVNGFDMERSSFPALVLGEGIPSIAETLTTNNNPTDIFIKQLETLAESGDLLVVIRSNSSSSRLSQTIKFALNKDLSVLVLDGTSASTPEVTTDDKCLHLSVASNKVARIQETHVLIINLLCYLVEKEIFGI
ncbi:MAG: SIS domain-containing protein [Candidatus Portiera sp.]|nr:SIS domain-containing protein [Portiera sp.]